MIGVFTSGGDAPGMNACIESIINNKQLKNKLLIIKKGLQGMIDDEIDKPEKCDCDLINISHLGGSTIKCYRSAEFMTEKGFNKALSNLKKHKIDKLIAIGGNGTLIAIKKLDDYGIKSVFIPATIDNDLFYTDKSLGFDTAINNIISDLDKIKQTMQSASRGAVVEVMGRNCGDLALFSAVATDADYVITVERPFDYASVLDKLKILKDGFLVVVQENLIDIRELANNLQNDLDLEVRSDVLGYMQRGGSPSVFDRIYAKRLAFVSAEKAQKLTNSISVGIKNNEIISIDIDSALKAKQKENHLANLIN